jgi:hypothetical protein
MGGGCPVVWLRTVLISRNRGRAYGGYIEL